MSLGYEYVLFLNHSNWFDLAIHGLQIGHFSQEKKTFDLCVELN